MSFWRQISPRRAVADFLTQWQPNPRRWQVMGVSIAATFFMMMMFLPENQRIDPRPPQITWITTFADGRTQEEIIASNIENQRRKEREQALEAEREEYRKSLYRALGRATGVDVDAMEREIAAEQKGETPAAQPSPTAEQSSTPAASGE